MTTAIVKLSMINCVSYFTTKSQVKSHSSDWVLLLQEVSGLKIKVAELEGDSGICDKAVDTSCDQVPHVPALASLQIVCLSEAASSSTHTVEA